MTKDPAPNVSSIPGLQSALNFFLNRIWMGYGCFQISEMFYPFKGNITQVKTGLPPHHQNHYRLKSDFPSQRTWPHLFAGNGKQKL